MNSDSLTAELLALAQTSPNDPARSKAARLRAVLPAVEAALSAGASREQVLEKLHAHGLDMSLAVFNTTLRRLRAVNRKTDSSRTSIALPAASAPTPPPNLVPAAAIPYLHDTSTPVDMEQLINFGKQERDKK